MDSDVSYLGVFNGVQPEVMVYLAAFDEDWKRWELPFPKNKQDIRLSALFGRGEFAVAVVTPAKEFKQFVLFDKALRGAQSDEKDAGSRDAQGFEIAFCFAWYHQSLVTSPAAALERSQNVLTKNVNAAARVALDMTTDSGRLWHCTYADKHSVAIVSGENGRALCSKSSLQEP